MTSEEVYNKSNICMKYNSSPKSASMNETFEYDRESWSNHDFNKFLLLLYSFSIVTINLLIAILFLTKKELRRKPANAMICSQACADIYKGAVFIPLCLVQTRLAQNIAPFMNGYMLYLETFHVCAMSLERYLAIIKPLMHYKIMHRAYMNKFVALVWLLPLTMVIIPMAWWKGPRAAWKETAQKMYMCAQWCIIFLIVFTVTVLYIFIIKRTRICIRRRWRSKNVSRPLLVAAGLPIPDEVCKEQCVTTTLCILPVGVVEDSQITTDNKWTRVRRKISTSFKMEEPVKLRLKSELRVVYLFGLLLFFLVAAYAPILYMNILILLVGKPERISDRLICVSVHSLILNSLVTPVLCLLLKKDYLDAFKRLLRITI